MADPEGEFEATAPKHLRDPVEWRPFVINAPMLDAYRSRNRDLKYSYTRVNNALHFVELQDLRAGLLPSHYYRVVSTMLFFRINTTRT